MYEVVGTYDMTTMQAMKMKIANAAESSAL